METIKNYLETMFMSLPMTEEVMRAKKELFQMMKDKYEELIAEGKKENEAVSIVISEFGNLDELAEGLGIEKVVADPEIQEKQTISREDAFAYISERARDAYRIALGVALLIISPIGAIWAEETTKHNFFSSEGFAIAFFFLCVGCGVGLLVYTGMNHSKWKRYINDSCAVTMATADEIDAEKRSLLDVRNLYVTIGIGACICGIAAGAIFESLMGDLSGIMFFIFVAAGVFCIIKGCVRIGAYDKLLALDGAGRFATEERGKKRSDMEHFDEGNKWLDFIYNCYWSTVVCVYLIISFITGAWYITWLIWPIAPIVRNFLITLCRKDK